jgi:hypothetical protein
MMTWTVEGSIRKDDLMAALRARTNLLLERIRSEFQEMPGLQLTVEQAHRLCGVELIACQAILDELVETNVVCVGVYAFIASDPFGRAPILTARPDHGCTDS